MGSCKNLKKRFGFAKRAKRGSEAVETSLISIGLLLISAVLVVIFVMISSSIFNLILKKQAQSTQESFNLLVTKLEEMDKGNINEAAHAYYIQDGYHLLGFNANQAGILHIRKDEALIKTQKTCGYGEACVCVCDDALCNGKIVDCNKGTGGKQVVFTGIKYFVVKGDDKNEFNQGKPIGSGLPSGTSGNYLAIFGKWGSGVDIGFIEAGIHHWPAGKIIYLKRNGDVVEIAFAK